MDYDEWTPLGHGDPLKNDPTYDYVPPVLDRVHYWMEPKESGASGARRDEAFVKFVDSSVPVPPTMLVPPPPPPPALPAVATTTPAPLAPGPPPASAYSSLNPFHHFEDRPVVPNVLFEEKPLFDSPLVQQVPQVPQVPHAQQGPQVQQVQLVQQGPQVQQVQQVRPQQVELQQQVGLPLPPHPPSPQTPAPAFFSDKPRTTPPPPPPEVSNAVVLDAEKPFLGPLAPSWSSPPAGPPPPVRPPSKQAAEKPGAVRPEGKPGPGKLAFPGPNALRAPPGKPLRFDDQPSQLRPPPSPPAQRPPPPARNTTTPFPTSTPQPSTSARPAASTPSPSDTINSLVRGLLQPEAPTTVATLTTDPLFAHYKQPVTPVNVHGPAYVIIQGHSKVKTYGPVLRRHDPPGQGPPGHRGAPGRRHGLP